MPTGADGRGGVEAMGGGRGLLCDLDMTLRDPRPNKPYRKKKNVYLLQGGGNHGEEAKSIYGPNNRRPEKEAHILGKKKKKSRLTCKISTYWGSLTHAWR